MPQKHPIIDEKGLDAAEAAWRASVEPTCKLMLRTAIRAYLSTVALPDELEVVAKQLRDFADDCRRLDLPEGRPGLAEKAADIISQAHSTIAALRAELYLLRNERDNFSDNLNEAITRGQVAEAEVKRLTEEKEAARESREWHRVSLEAQTANLRAAEAERDALRKALFGLHEAVDSEIDIGAQSSAFRKRVVAARQALSGTKE